LRSPKHQVTLGGQYVIETGAESNLTLRADYVYRSKYLLETGGLGAKVGGVQVASTNPGFVEAANNVLDLRATYTLDRWSLAVWGTNLTDNYIRSAVTGTSVTRANGTPGGIGVISYAEPPRMYGMTLGYKF
jgi:outer membrane receptor protein involved in Fe transport